MMPRRLAALSLLSAASALSATATRRSPLTVAPQSNDPLVIAGQGTIALELLQQVEEVSAGGRGVDAILVPTSGGGMLTGIATAARSIDPSVRVIACEPAGKCLQKALEADTRVLDSGTANAPLETICDAIRTQPLGPVPWELARQHVERSVLTVSDDDVRAALCLTLAELKQCVEPAGAV